MAHFAQLDKNNTVINVIVIDNNNMLDENGDESEAVGIAFLKSLYGENTNWKQTSYNTNRGIHYANDGTPDGGVALRKNYASLGYVYNAEEDAFIPPRPYPSYIYNSETADWDPPVPHPVDQEEGVGYDWDEGTLSWVKVS